MKSMLSSIVVVVGVGLLAISLVWGLLFPANRGWTEEKAARLAELTKQSHTLMFQVNAAKQKPSMHSGSDAGDVQKKYKDVTEERDTLRAEFEGKRDSPKTAATILRWSGIAFVVAGGIIVFASRDA